MRRLILMSAIAILTSLSAGSAHAGDSCEGRERYSIYYALHAWPDPWWSIMEGGAKQGATDACLDMKWTADTKFSIAGMIERIDTAIAEHPDLLVISAVDAVAEEQSVKRAHEAGIPVIAVNVPDTRPAPERLPYLIYIGGNEYEGGVEAANQVLAKMSPKKAACLIHGPGHVGLEARCAGWSDTLSAKGVSTTKIDISGGIAQAEAALSAYILANPDADAFFTLGPSPESFGVTLETLRKEGKIGKAALATYDLSPDVLRAIKAGEAVAAIDQQPYLQGYLPAVLGRQFLEVGLMPGRDILTGPGVVNIENVDQVIKGTDLGRR